MLRPANCTADVQLPTTFCATPLWQFTIESDNTS